MKILSYKGLELSIFLMILFVAVYLRFWNLEDNPAWYTDEATHIEIAENILVGENRYFAIGDSYLLFARLPLFEYSLAFIFWVFGSGMLVLRSFTASLGVFCVVLVYLVMRNISKNVWQSLWVSFIYAVMPQATLYSRFGFSYNLLLPLILLSLWATVNYQDSRHWRWLVLLGVCIGLGTVSEFLGWSFIPLCLIANSWRAKLNTMILMLAPLMLYCGWNLITVSDAFLFDLNYSLGRTGGGTIFQQFGRLIENYSFLLSDVWWLMGFIGIFLLQNRTLRFSCLIFFLPLLFVGRAVPLYSLSAYYTLPFLPLVAIGTGTFFYYGFQYLLNILREHLSHWVAGLITIILCFSPLAYIIFKEIEKVSIFYPTAIDAFLLNPHDVRAVSDYIHRHSSSNEMIVASTVVAAALDRPGTDFQMAVVAMGYDAIHIPHDLPLARFAYSADFRESRYVVVDNLWRNWGLFHMPALVEMLAEVETWELVFESGALQVFENPER